MNQGKTKGIKLEITRSKMSARSSYFFYNH